MPGNQGRKNQTRKLKVASNGSKAKKPQQSHKKKVETRHFGCGLCKADHRIVSCKKFSNLNLEKKYETIRKLHYCSNCLARNHLLEKCTNPARCRVCGLKHHTVLHGHKKILNNLKKSVKPQANTEENSSKQGSGSTSMAIGLPSSLKMTFVPTAEIYAMLEDGCVLTRAIINPSSTCSRIAHTFVKKNHLKAFDVDGKTYVKTTITPNMSSTTKYDMYFLVTKELPKYPHSRGFKESIKDRFGNLALADPNFFTNDPVEHELGGDIYSSILKSNVIHIDGGSVIAQDTTLGWLIMGSYSA